jgi:hypothetical protein
MASPDKRATATDWRPPRREASVEPSERHTEQSDKDDGADQDPSGSRIHASLLSIGAGCYSSWPSAGNAVAGWPGQRARLFGELMVALYRVMTVFY